jgi:hypothetical protein
LIAAKSPFAGSWTGRTNGLPGVDLTVETAGGKIIGSVVFYLQKLGPDGKWRVAGRSAVPLLAGRVEGDVLKFEVPHHKQHGGSEYGPNVKFELKLTGVDQASLHRLGDHSADEPEVKLTRSKTPDSVDPGRVF